MEKSNFKESHFTIMIICFTVACVFLVFSYFATNGFAQRSYQQMKVETDSNESLEQNQNNSNRGNHLSRIDKDGDGKISQDEFPGPDEHFTQFDIDEDGYLDESEMPKGPPSKKGEKHFSRIDKDGDRKISQDEFPGPDEHFAQFDTHEDGYLDESEMPKRPPCRK